MASTDDRHLMAGPVAEKQSVQRSNASMSDLRNLREPQAFRALLYSARIDAALERQVDVALPPSQFFPLLVKALEDYGRLADGRHPVTAILNAVKKLGGQEIKAACDAVIREIG